MDYNTLKAVHKSAEKHRCTPSSSEIEAEYEMLAKKKWFQYGIIETFLEKIRIVKSYMKRVGSWAKMKLGYLSVVCKKCEDEEMPDYIEWTPKPLNTRPITLGTITGTIERMHEKACKELNNGLPVLRSDQIQDIARKLEEKLLNNLNAELEQAPIDEHEAWHEYGLRGNRMARSLHDMTTFVATVDQYLTTYP